VIHEVAFRKCFDLAATRRLIERERGRKLEAGGWTTLRFRPAEIRYRPERVLRAVGCALARTAHLSSVSRR
jgi:very-short-patch-repair endonuclease